MPLNGLDLACGPGAFLGRSPPSQRKSAKSAATMWCAAKMSRGRCKALGDHHRAAVASPGHNASGYGAVLEPATT